MAIHRFRQILADMSFITDDDLFKFWREEKCTVEDVLSKAHNPDDLAKRIVNAKRGILDNGGTSPED